MSQTTSSLTRRDFLKLTGLAASGTVLVGCNGEVGSQLASLVEQPDGYVAGMPVWYASVCQECPAGCGIRVKTLEGRAKKIEGNPEHPINRGRLCARGQASLQALYNPDRFRFPCRKNGGRYDKLSWDEALDTVAQKLREADPQSVVFLGRPLNGHLGWVASRFMNALGGPPPVAYGFQSIHEGRPTLRRLANELFGADALPVYDLENTRYLLSFGADFLETWLSPVSYGVGYGEMRQGYLGRRGRFVHVSPRMSLTAANADEWLPARPGTEATLALGLAYVIVHGGLQVESISAAEASEWQAALAAYDPAHVADMCGVSSRDLVRVAVEYAESGGGLAVAGAGVLGHTNGLAAARAVNVLNHLVGAIGAQGRLRPGPKSPVEWPMAEADLQTTLDLVDRMNNGRVQLLLVHEANSVFETPAVIGFREAVDKVPFIASFSSFMDETSALAGLILPDHASLESWGAAVPEPGAGVATLGLGQPVVRPLYDSRATADVLMALAARLGGAVAEALPWPDTKTMLAQIVGGDEREWIAALQAGGRWSTEAMAEARATLPTPADVAALSEAQFDGEADAYPLHLHVYPSVALGDGRGANRPWLQEMPDPTTTVMWGSWVEMNPETAHQLGVGEGDVVSVESAHGRIEAPVVFYPGLRPDVVAVPVGQGHESYGRYAEGRGANPIAILSPLTDADTGNLAWAATRVRAAKSGAKGGLIRFAGSDRFELE